MRLTTSVTRPGTLLDELLEGEHVSRPRVRRTVAWLRHGLGTPPRRIHYWTIEAAARELLQGYLGAGHAALATIPDAQLEDDGGRIIDAHSLRSVAEL